MFTAFEAKKENLGLNMGYYGHLHRKVDDFRASCFVAVD